MGVSNKQNVSICLSFGVIAEIGPKWRPYWISRWRSPGGANMLGVFFPAPLGWVYPCAKFHACFKNWTILVDIWYLPLYYVWMLHWFIVICPTANDRCNGCDISNFVTSTSRFLRRLSYCQRHARCDADDANAYRTHASVTSSDWDQQPLRRTVCFVMST